MATLIEGEQALLGLVVPNLDDTIISTRHQVRSFKLMAEIKTVDTGFMANQAVIGGGLSGSDSPNLDGLVKRGRTEHGRFLGVDLELHDVVFMIHKRVNFRPVLVPVKHADGVIIRAREYVG